MLFKRIRVSSLIVSLALIGLAALLPVIPAQANDVLRFRATKSDTAGAMSDYWTFSSASRTVEAGDYVEYDVYINNNSAGVGGIDIKNTDDTYWRSEVDWQDQNGITGHPQGNIASRAYGKWYHRKLAVPASVVGKTISLWDVAVDGTYGADAVLSAQYDNIVITNSESVVLTAYSEGVPGLDAQDFSSGSADRGLLYGPVRKPGTQIGTFLFYWYTAPNLNAAASSMVYHPYGLKDDPWVGYEDGYYSNQNVAWWEAEFQDMKKAGIDIASLICWGNHPWGTFGMRQISDYMVPALERSGCDIKIACFDDTTSEVCEWNNANGRGYVGTPPMPLSDTTNWEYFYDKKIKLFFDAFPKKYWATHNGLSIAEGGRPIIIVYTSAWFSDVPEQGAALWQWVKNQFARDFKDTHGNDIVPWVILEQAWGSPISADGKYAWGSALLGPNTNGVNGYYVSSVGPGFDNRIIRPPGEGLLAARYDGGQMVRWFNSKPSGRNIYDSNLILGETWNELWEGTALQRCKDYPADAGGYLPETHYMDIWRNLVTSSVGLKDYDATFVRTWTVAKWGFEPVSVKVRNDGFLPWNNVEVWGWLVEPDTGAEVAGTRQLLGSLPSTVLSGEEYTVSLAIPAIPSVWPKFKTLKLDLKDGAGYFSAYGDQPVSLAYVRQYCSTRNWVVQHHDAGIRAPIRSLAVDQTTGDIYAMRPDATVVKYDKTGALLWVIGPAVKDAGGVTKFTLSPTAPAGLAVDPLTRYLHINNGSTVHAVDTSAATAVWKSSFATGMNAAMNTCFTDDGQRFYVGGYLYANEPGPPIVTYHGAREFGRSGNTFAATGVEMDKYATSPPLAYGDVRSCTVDRNGKVYVGDLGGSQQQVRRYLAGANTLDMEFKTATRQWGIATDASNNFWTVDIETAPYVRCYTEGSEICSFDTLSGGGLIGCPWMVACDRANGRVIVAGEATVSGTKSYLQSWTVSEIIPDDTTPPSPDPMEWQTEPYAVSAGSISMTAAAATDERLPVSYYFTETTSNPGGSSSDWWGASYTDSGLNANTQYGYKVKARDSGICSPPPNVGSDSSTILKYTLSVPPSTSTITCDNTAAPTFTFTAVGGFGAGTIQYYRYEWDQTSTHEWTGSETQWSSGTLVKTATSPGKWYLHVKGYNAEDVENGTLDFNPLAPSIVFNWEVGNEPGATTVLRSLAVDQTNGDIYVGRFGGITAKYDKTGAFLWTIGPGLYDGAVPPVLKATVTNGNPSALAVDPLTRYLYISYAANVYVMDTSTSTAVWKRTIPSVIISPNWNTGFTDDGQKFYTSGRFSADVGGVTNMGAHQFTRNAGTTPADYTDDTFVASVPNVDMKVTGTMEALLYGNVQSCTVDRNAKVYVGDMHATKRPVRRYLAGANTLDIEFQTPTPQFGMSTDASNNFWSTDISSTTLHSARCYAEGVESFNIDCNALPGHIYNPLMVACDRTNGRVIVAGNTGSLNYLQSWSVLEAIPDTAPPSPDPITWLSQPSAASTSSIAMAATAATDAHRPVSYYFTETTSNPGSTSSGWTTFASYTDSGLNANTQYGYKVKARDSQVTPNVGSDSSTILKYTLSVAPSASTITCNKTAAPTFTFTAVGGFGAGTVEYYRYAWDQTATHTWTGSETQWSSGTLPQTATLPGAWYLHVKGYNADNVANGTLDINTAGPSGTFNWEVENVNGAGTIRSLAVDQTNGDIYVYRPNATVAKYDKTGALLWVIGPAIYDGTVPTPVLKLTLAAGAPIGLAVDPLTRYLYISHGANVQVVDTSAATAVWKRVFATGLTGAVNTSFTDDGQKFYVSGKFSATANDQGAREFARDNAGTPSDYTDDTFAATGVDMKVTGTMPTLGYVDVRSCTVDRNGKVYVGDLHAATPAHPVRRYLAGANTLDMEFAAVTRPWGIATDASNNFWSVDIATVGKSSARCYANGVEFFSIDCAGQTGRILYPQMVACDRTNSRVIVAGDNAVSGATKSYLQSWNVWLGFPETTPPSPDPMTWQTEPYAASASSIAMTATAATDAHRPVAYYFTETTSNPGGSPSGWTTFASYTDSGLAANTQYGYKVKARDSELTPNVGSDSITILKYTLSVAPTTSTVTCDKAASAWYSTSTFTFTAVGGFGAGTIQYYRYAWDQTATHTWTGSETQWSSGTLPNTATTDGSWYLHVKGYNAVDVENGTLDLGPYNYDGTTPTVSIAGAKMQGDGPPSVWLESKIVTAVFSDRFYITEADRNIGVQVSPLTMPVGLAVNKTVTVRGTMRTDSMGERCIGNADATATVTGDGPAGGIMPLGMINKTPGGYDWLYNDVTKAGQKGVVGGLGTNNIGLLVRVWGQITGSGTDFIVINDGSVVPVRVDTTRLTSPPTSGYAAVTGISSLYTGYASVIIARGDSDIRVF